MPSALFGRPLHYRLHFTLQHNFEKSWEYAKDVFTCLFDLDEANDRVPCENLWSVFRKYGAYGRLLLAVKSLISDQNFVSMLGELHHDRPPLVLDSNNGVCCHRSFS